MAGLRFLEDKIRVGWEDQEKRGWGWLEVRQGQPPCELAPSVPGVWLPLKDNGTLLLPALPPAKIDICKIRHLAGVFLLLLRYLASLCTEI